MQLPTRKMQKSWLLSDIFEAFVLCEGLASLAEYPHYEICLSFRNDRAVHYCLYSRQYINPGLLSLLIHAQAASQGYFVLWRMKISRLSRLAL